MRRFLADEDGPTAVEYAVMLAVIVLAGFVALRQLGISMSETFGQLSSTATPP